MMRGVYSTMKNNPPSYGLTTWEDTPNEEWDLDELKNEIKKQNFHVTYGNNRRS